MANAQLWRMYVLVSGSAPVKVQASGPDGRASALRDVTATIRATLGSMTTSIREQRLNQVGGQHDDLVRERVVGQARRPDTGRRARARLMAQLSEFDGKRAYPISTGARRS